jgi:two-component system sensor histidine kinase HydH
MEPEDYRYTQLMLTEVDRLNRVISKLLAYSKPREPRLTIRSIEEIVDHCVRVVEREALEAGVEIVVSNVDSDLPLALVDSDQMMQVFLNILINAIEATPKGGKVSVKLLKDSHDRLRVVTEDTGEGIPRENVDKLFDPFFSTKKKGTGLGLAIVKSIIEGHGGEIEVESDPTTGGARFIVVLNPYEAPQEVALEKVESRDSPASAV